MESEDMLTLILIFLGVVFLLGYLATSLPVWGA